MDSTEASESLAGIQQGWEAVRAGGTAVLFDEVCASWLWGTCISSLCKTRVISGGREEEGRNSNLYTMHQCCRMGEVYSLLLHQAIIVVSNAEHGGDVNSSIF